MEHKSKRGANVFPKRDLPGRAEEWGRTVERYVKQVEGSLTQVEQKVDNGLRATSGQLELLANQVRDVAERRTEIAPAEVSGIKVGASPNGLTYDFTQTWVTNNTVPRMGFIEYTYKATEFSLGNTVYLLDYDIIGDDVPLGDFKLISAFQHEGGSGSAIPTAKASSWLKVPPGGFTAKVRFGIQGFPSLPGGSFVEFTNGFATLTLGEEVKD